MKNQDFDLAALYALVPATLPSDVRDEAVQGMAFDIVSGELLAQGAPRQVQRYIKEAYRILQPMQERSLDAPVGDDPDSATLGDFLVAPDDKLEEEPSPTRIPPELRMSKRRGMLLKGQWPTCQHCQKRFYTYPSRIRMYCSMACRRAGGWHGPSRPHLRRLCLYCKEPFEVTPGVAKRYPAKYCSRSCARHGKKGTHNRQIGKSVCPVCKQVFPLTARRKVIRVFCGARCAMKAWHRKQTFNRGCHWCGKPSLPEYKNACAKHVRYARANERRLRLSRKKLLLSKGMCLYCGRHAAMQGFQICKTCSSNAKTKAKERRKENRKTLLLSLKDLGLIDVNEAATKYLFVHRTRVHEFIDSGQLLVVRKEFHRFWLRREQVVALAEVRGAYR